MKKSIFFLAGILGLSLASCDDTSDLGKPQVNPKPVEVQANGVKATASSVLTKSTGVNLSDYVSQNIPILDIQIDNTFPESATLVGTFQVADNEAFTNAVEIPITMEELPEPTKADEAAPRKYVGVIEGNLWEDAFVGFYGNAPYEQPNYYRYLLYIQDGTQVIEVNHEYTPGVKIAVTPVDLKLDVEPKYFITGKYIGKVEMTHSDKHEYDDPIFSYVVNVDEASLADFTWAIVPESAQEDSSKYYGVEDKEKSTGNLLLMSEGGVNGQITEEGAWKIEVNMLTKMYTVSLAAETLYVFGPASSNGFGPRALQLTTSDFVTYSGVGLINGTFRLAAQKSANKGVVYGAGAAEGQLALGTGTEGIAVSTPNGLYMINANVVKLSYELTYIKSIGLVGAFNNWGNDIDLKPNRYFTEWTADVTVAAPGEFKFRANGDWAINWGGALDNLVAGGDNLSFSEAGTYSVKLDFSKIPYSATVTKK